MASPKSPTLKNLPHAPEEIIKGIETGVKLRPAETQEKVVLPDEQEWKEVKETKAEHLRGIKEFNKRSLSEVEPEEKVILPDAKEWTEVKEAKAAHLAGIEQFPKQRMSHVEPEVKLLTPTAEEIARDQGCKQAYKQVKDEAATFDKSQLKHAETTVKTEPVVDKSG